MITATKCMYQERLQNWLLVVGKSPDSVRYEGGIGLGCPSRCQLTFIFSRAQDRTKVTKTLP